MYELVFYALVLYQYDMKLTTTTLRIITCTYQIVGKTDITWFLSFSPSKSIFDTKTRRLILTGGLFFGKVKADWISESIYITSNRLNLSTQ